MSDLTPKLPTEAEAREIAEDAINAGPYDAAAVLDAYAGAIRAAERARLAGLVGAMRITLGDAMRWTGCYGEIRVFDDVLRLLTEDTAR